MPCTARMTTKRAQEDVENSRSVLDLLTDEGARGPMVVPAGGCGQQTALKYKGVASGICNGDKMAKNNRTEK